MSMSKKIILLVVASLAFVGLGCSRASDQAARPGAGDNIPLNVSDGSEMSSGAITLDKPEPDAVLSSPFLVSGSGEFGDGRAYVRVKNKAGQSVIEAWTAAKGASGKFSVMINFNFRGTTEGTVEVFGKDASGVETGLQSVPVKFDVAASEEAEAIPEE